MALPEKDITRRNFELRRFHLQQLVFEKLTQLGKGKVLGFDENPEASYQSPTEIIVRVLGKGSFRNESDTEDEPSKIRGACLVCYDTENNSIKVFDNISGKSAPLLTLYEWRLTLNKFAEDNSYKQNWADNIYNNTLAAISRNREKASGYVKKRKKTNVHQTSNRK